MINRITGARFLASAAILALAVPASARAQDEQPSEDGEQLASETSEDQAPPVPLGENVFTPADFARFNPQTALDMVRQIPGFNIQGGDQGQRGLGQASQNVLINGQRVSGKSNDAATALSRIPASAVERIEIVDGATLDIPGLTGQVANVFAKTTTFSGNYRWEPQIRPGLEDNLLAGNVSLSGRIGATDWTAGFANNANRSGHWGPEFARRPDGSLIEVRDEHGAFYIDAPRVTGSISRTAANGNILNLNVAGGLFLADQTVTGEVTRGDGATFDELFLGTEDEWNAELGGDYEFALGGGRLKLIGLQRYEHSPSVSDFSRTADQPGAVAQGNRFDQTIDEGESIARGEYRWKSGASDWQVSVEGAYNTLDSEAELFVRDNSGDLQFVPLPGASAKVSEKRAETIATYGRPLADNLSLQANLGGEFSNIVVSGPDGDSRSFVRPKGSVALAWTVDPALTVNAKIERRVDQLNFFDFLASVDVANDTDRANNPQLVPPQRWRGEIELVSNLGEWGSLKPYIRVASIEDVVETIPISATEEALGNLDTPAFVLQPGVQGTVQFDPLGWKGAKLDLFYQYTHTRLDDPLTGESRPISGSQRQFYALNLRHDVPETQWAWGGFIEENISEPVVRLGQVARQFQTEPQTGLFVEHKDVLGLTVRATVINLLDSKDGFERTVYQDRRTGPIAFTEYREREYGRIWAFSVSGKI